MTYQNRISKLYDIYVVIENFNNKLTGELSQELIEGFRLFKQGSNIQKGDVLHNIFEGNHGNEGKYIFDGENLTELDYTLDPFGSCTDILLGITEVPVNFWNNTIDNNLFIWCDLSSFELKNIKKLTNITYIGIIENEHNNYAILYNNIEYLNKKNIYERFGDEYDLDEYCISNNICKFNILITYELF